MGIIFWTSLNKKKIREGIGNPLIKWNLFSFGKGIVPLKRLLEGTEIGWEGKDSMVCLAASDLGDTMFC